MMSTELARRVSMLPATYETGNKSTGALPRDVAKPDALHKRSEPQVEQVLRGDLKLVVLWFKRAADIVCLAAGASRAGRANIGCMISRMESVWNSAIAFKPALPS